MQVQRSLLVLRLSVVSLVLVFSSSAFAGGPADTVIDADGILTAGDGIPNAVDCPCGHPLSSFPAAVADAGVDWFDNDNNGQWTFGMAGDDIHSEDPNTCPGAVRDGVHTLGADCKIIDLDASLVNGQQVNCDLEVNVAFTEPHVSNGGCPSTINLIRWCDTNQDGGWDSGEDIIYDANDDGIYNCAIVPAVSEWGLLVLTLIGLIVGTTMFSKRFAPAAT